MTATTPLSDAEFDRRVGTASGADNWLGVLVDDARYHRALVATLTATLERAEAGLTDVMGYVRVIATNAAAVLERAEFDRTTVRNAQAAVRNAQAAVRKVEP